MKTYMHIFADSIRGQYIPQHFAEDATDSWTITPEDRATLLDGPSHEWYWETWEHVLSFASYVDSDGDKWTLHTGENGDLFAIVYERLTLEEKENMGFDVEPEYWITREYIPALVHGDGSGISAKEYRAICTFSNDVENGKNGSWDVGSQYHLKTCDVSGKLAECLPVNFLEA